MRYKTLILDVLKKACSEVVMCTKYRHLLGEGEKLIFGACDFPGYSCNN
jgi:hypothetical protein